MTVQAWLIFSPQESAEAVSASENTDFKVYPREIDNPLVSQLGDPLVLVGNFVAPARILNDPEFAPVWTETLGALPIRLLDSDILFLPPTV